MSIHRYAAKVDSSAASIVKCLRAIGVEVYDIRRPVDKLLRFWCARHRDYCWQTLEIKTASGKRAPKARVRADQERQQEFIRRTNTPVVTSFDEALRELNLRHHLASITVPKPI